jgi:competence protein ComEC
MIKLDKEKKVLTVAVLLIGNYLAWLAVFGLFSQKPLAITFFDIGQGDAIFIETVSRQQVLIDGGKDSLILEKLNQEMPFWDRRLDLLILTHSEHDHLGGLIEVIKSYRVDRIVSSGTRKDNSENDFWENSIKEKNIGVKLAKAGAKIGLEGAVLEIIWPEKESRKTDKNQNTNDLSLVSRLLANGHSYLFTGDISDKVEKKLAEQNLIAETTVLKIAHHGSKNSASSRFLKETSPYLAIISVGKNNSYGHPAKKVLERLEKYGIKVLRTDQNGSIRIEDNGNKISVITEK